jgi:hypothetical protein
MYKKYVCFWILYTCNYLSLALQLKPAGAWSRLSVPERDRLVVLVPWLLKVPSWDPWSTPNTWPISAVFGEHTVPSFWLCVYIQLFQLTCMCTYVCLPMFTLLHPAWCSFASLRYTTARVRASQLWIAGRFASWTPGQIIGLGGSHES